MIFNGVDVPEYMIAFCPNADVVDFVSVLKEELFIAIGKRFKSHKANGHFTIDWVDATDEILDIYIRNIEMFVVQLSSKTVKLNAIKDFGETAIYVAPDNEADRWMKLIARRYFKQVRGMRKSINPHMTIGKNIATGYLDQAKAVFNNIEVNISFLCDNIALRKFNPIKGQYEVIKRFYFNNDDTNLKFINEGNQLNLF